MKVRAGGGARRPDTTDERPRRDALTAADGERGEMGVPRSDAVSVPHGDEVPVAAAVPAGEEHAAGARGPDRSAVARREVEAGVETVSARPEAVSDTGAHRPGQAERRARNRTPERGERGRARNAVDADPSPALEAPEGGFGPGPEAAVDRSRGESVPGEQELELRDVEADPAAPEHATTEGRAAEPSERTLGLRPCDPVHDQAAASLETTHAALGQAPVDAVDRAGVEAPSAERDLEGGDRGSAHRAGSTGETGTEGEDEHESGCEACHARRIRPLRWASCASLRRDDVSSAAEQERRRYLLRRHAAERRVTEFHFDLVPAVDPERRSARFRPDPQKLGGRDDVASKRLATGDALDLAELLERVDPDVRVRADADRDSSFLQPLDRQKSVAEVRLGRRAGADAGPRVTEQVELCVGGVRGVDDRRLRAEAARLCQELDRPAAVLGETLLDLAWLLVGMDVEDEILARGVRADLPEPASRAGANGVGGEPDARTEFDEPLDLAEVFRHGVLPEAIQPAAAVRGEEEHELDPGCAGRLDSGPGLREADVVKLANHRVAGRAHLAVRRLVLGSDAVRCQTAGHVEHGIPPGPEVVALRPPPERTLERVAVGVHEPRQGQARHRARLAFEGMEARAVHHPLAQLPNALTVVRLALIPIFVVVVLGTDGEGSIAAASLFAAAGATDQVDGWLARRWQVESEFGKLVDPLADRLMIAAAVVLLWLDGRLPWPALAVILLRDAALIGGYGLVMNRGYEFSVSMLGKVATWILYAALTALLASGEGTTWALLAFWAGAGVGLAAAVLYITGGFRSLAR